MSPISQRMFLSTFAAISLMLGAWTEARAGGEYVQAATCGSAQSDFFKTNAEAFVTLDRKGTMWRGTNTKEGDKCGLILFLGADRHVLRRDRESEIVFDSITDEVKNNSTVILVFKPQFGLPDLITVTKPLKDFSFGEWLGHPIAFISVGAVFKAAGVPDLKKLTVKYTGTKNVIVRHLRIEAEDNSWSDGDIRVSPTLDCSALDQVSAPKHGFDQR